MRRHRCAEAAGWVIAQTLYCTATLCLFGSCLMLVMLKLYCSVDQPCKMHTVSRSYYCWSATTVHPKCIVP